MVWVLQTVGAWCVMSIGVWVVSRHLATREVERVRLEYEWMRLRMAKRREELRRALEEPDQLDRPVYVMLINELMWLAQLERRWLHGEELEPDADG